MADSLQIGTIAGIPIKLHFTFLLVIPLFAFIIGYQIEYTIIFLEEVFGIQNINTSLITGGFMPYTLGVVVTLSLFAGVLLHELSHSVVAKKNGLNVSSITLMILGGVASIDQGKSPDPKVELPMAIAGPVASFVIGAAASLAAYLSYEFIPYPAVAGLMFYVFGYLGVLNILLFLFNLIPAFPMDGGRVLRALLARRLPIYQATKISADIGRAFAVIFGIFGIFVLNPILVIIAIFIYLGAGQEAEMTKFNELLRDVKIKEAMTSPVITVEPDMRAEEIINLMYSTKHLGYPVTDRGSIVGMITLSDISKVSGIDREAMIARDIMTRDVIALTPEAMLSDAMRIMSLKNIGRIPVAGEDGTVLGIVTRTDILRFIELREIS
ncbi:Zn-dependent protease/predicted transcriptional regulator [Methanomicrobium sp. W14]|uniref:CBS domain-containing protein n=1 Tax=Methanomicrobium sp. W14 TaxID=2817839 RepID=UPI001AE359E7|nr:CBS domain-containing protein [Methanomicrobium sp. W14]MBP2133045.1 Zn-dependent protease/predicted transcriptional regulator [Methanomicrobium sp. W14]